MAFGSTLFDTPVARTVTITNTQTSPFSTGSLMLGNISTPAGYAFAGFPAVALANGQSATFSVTLPAANTGLFNAALTFTGNDRFNPSLASAGAGMPNQHALILTGLVTDTADH